MPEVRQQSLFLCILPTCQSGTENRRLTANADLIDQKQLASWQSEKINTLLDIKLKTTPDGENKPKKKTTTENYLK